MTAAVVAASSGPALAAGKADKWHGHAETVLRPGTEETSGTLETFLPLAQDEDSLFFLDLRLSANDVTDYYGNWGAGFRQIVAPDLILGLNAFLDAKRSDDDNSFAAVTLGAEALTSSVEARINVHLPLNTGAKHVSNSALASTGAVSVIDHRLVEGFAGQRVDEFAMYGVEGEAGVRLPFQFNPGDEFRIFAGGYHYWSAHTDNISGVRGRIEYRINDAFDIPGSQLNIGGEITHDNYHGTEGTAEVRLRIPFPAFLGGTNGSSATTVHLTPIEQRMTERVRRDLDITTRKRTKATAGFAAAINPATGMPYGAVFFADGANSPGTGDAADPTTLDDAVFKAADDGIIVALGGLGNLNTSGVTLADGQYLLGGGSSLMVKLADGTTTTFSFTGTPGTIFGTDPAADVVTLGDGNTVQGVKITGGKVGIAGSDIDSAMLDGVTVENTGGDGVAFTGTTTGVTANNLTVNGAGGNGITITGDGNYNFTGTTTVTDPAADGINITGDGNYAFETTDITTLAGDGIEVTSTSGSFSNTGGTINATGGMATKFDPLTIDAIFDSLTATGGVHGIQLVNVTGSFTVTGATDISAISGDAISIVNSAVDVALDGPVDIANPGANGIAIDTNAGTMSFAPTTIADPGVNGIVIAGSNGAVSFGDTDITGLGANSTGVDLRAAQGAVSFQTLDITAANATSTRGIDLAGSTNTAATGTVESSTITGTAIGVDLTNASQTAMFQFGDGSNTDADGAASTIIAATPIEIAGLNAANGTYDFEDVNLVGDVNSLITDATLFFVDTTPGAGTASDPGTLAQAELSGADAIILVNDGSAGGTGTLDALASNGDDTFSLAANQQVVSFLNSSTAYVGGGAPLNLLLNGITPGVVSDPTGNGAPLLATTGVGPTVTLADGNRLDGVDIDGQVAGTGNNGVIIQRSDLTRLSLTGATGMATLDGVDLGTLAIDGGDIAVAATGTSLDNAAGTATLLVTGGHSGALSFDATTSIAATGGPGLVFAGADGSYDLAGPVTLNGGSAGIAITGGSTGHFSFADTMITNPSGTAFLVADSAATVDFTGGAISQTNPAAAVIASGNTGGAINIAVPVIAHVGNATAVQLTGNMNTTVTFAGGLDLSSDGQTTFLAVDAGRLNVLNTTVSNTISASNATALDLTRVTMGDAGITFTSLASTNAAGAGVSIVNVDQTGTAGFSSLATTIAMSGANGIYLNAQPAVIDFTGVTTVSGSAASNVLIAGPNGPISFANLISDGAGDAGLAIQAATGDVTVSSGSFGASAANLRNVAISGQTSGTMAIDNVAFASATQRNLSVTGNAGAIGFAGGSLDQTGGQRPINIVGNSSQVTIGNDIAIDGGISEQIFISGNTGVVTFDGSIALANSFLDALYVANNAGGATFNGAITATNSGDEAIQVNANGGDVNFNATVTVNGAGDYGISLDSNAGAVNFADVAIDGARGGIQFATATSAANFGHVTITGLGSRPGIDLNGTNVLAPVNFASVDITGPGTAGSIGVDLTDIAGNQIVRLGAVGASDSTTDTPSRIANVERGVVISDSSAVQFTFGDGFDTLDQASTIDVIAGGYTVDAANGTLAGSSFDFQDVTFAAGDMPNFPVMSTTTFVSQSGGVLSAGTFGLSADIATVSLADAEAMTGAQTFAFIGAIDTSGLGTDGFNLDSTQNITGFANGNAVAYGLARPMNILGSFGTLGGTLTADSAVVTNSTAGDHVITLGGDNAIDNNIFELAAGTGSVFNIDGTAAGFVNGTGITIENTIIRNVGPAATVFDIANVNDNVTAQNNDIDVAGWLLDANAGTGNIAITRGTGASFTAGRIATQFKSGGTVDIAGPLTLVNASNADTVRLQNNAGATINFTGGLDIVTNSTLGFFASTGGTINVAGAGNTITSQTGRLVYLEGVTIGADGINFDNMTTTGASTLDTIRLGSVDGGTFTGGAVTIAGASTDGINVNNSSADVAFTSLDISATAGAGIRLFDNTGGFTVSGPTTIDGATDVSLLASGQTGAYSFGDVTVNNRGNTGISIIGGQQTGQFGNVTINNQNNMTASALAIQNLAAGSSITFASAIIDNNGANASGIGLFANAGKIDIQGGSITGAATSAFLAAGNLAGADIDFAGTITNTAGLSVNLTNNTGGTVDLSGTIIDTGLGIQALTNTGGTFTFSGATQQLTTGSNNAVTLSTNAGATFSFTGGGLDIDTTTGLGLNATGGGTVNIVGTGNTIATTDGKALNMNGVTVDATFASIDSARSTAGAGISLTNLDGSFALNGGTITAPVGADFAAVDILQNDATATRSLQVAIDGITVTQDATASAGSTEFGVGGAINDDDTLIISIANSTFETEDQAINLDSANGQLVVTDLSDNVLLSQATAAQPNLFNNGISFRGVRFDADPGTAVLDPVSGGSLLVGSAAAPTYLALNFVASGQNPARGNDGTVVFDDVDINAERAFLVESDQSAATLKILDGDVTARAITINPTTAVNLDVSLSSLSLMGNQSIGGLQIKNATGTFSVIGGATIVAPEFGFTTGGGSTLFRLKKIAVDIRDSALDVWMNDLDIGSATTPPSGIDFSIPSGGSTNGINLSGNSGSFTVSGTTTIAPTVEDAIRIENSSGAISFGQTTINNPGEPVVSGITSTNPTLPTTIAGVGLAGTISGPVSFAGLDIALQTDNRTGVNLAGATLDSSLSVDSFALASTTATGTVGLDLTGTTGTGTVQIGDTVAGGPNNASISGVATGVLFSSATNIDFGFGDREGTTDTDSSIAATTPIDDDGSGLPASGTYNFDDVVFTGNTANLTPLSIYYIDQNNSGDGSAATPGTIAGAEASTANVFVLVDTNVNAGTDSINASVQDTGTFNLADNAILVSYKSTDTAIDASTLGVPLGGAPASFSFTTISNSTLIPVPGSIDTVRPVLTTTGANNTLTLGGSAAIQTVTVTNNGTGAGITGNFATDETVSLSSSNVGGNSFALEFAPTGGTTTLGIADTTFIQGLKFDGSGAGSIAATATGTNNVVASAAQILDLDTVTIGGAGMTFGILQSIGSVVSGNAINISNVSGGAFSGGAVAIAGTTAGDGVHVDNSSANVSFASLGISSVSGDGVELNSNTGSFAVAGTTTVNVVGAAGVNIVGGNSTINFGSGSIQNTVGAAFQASSNTAGANIDFAGTITNTAGKSVNILNNSGGTIDLTGNIGDTGAGIAVTNNTGGTFTFSGATKTVSTGANPAVTISGNAGATVNFTGGGLDIDTTTGTGFSATGGGTVTVQGTGNSVTSTTGTAVNIANTTIGAAGVTFRSVSSNGAASGIVLTNTGTTGSFTVTGDGGAANNDSGGSILNATGDGISLTSAGTVSLGYMRVQSAALDGIAADNVNTLNVTRSNIVGNGGNGIAASFTGTTVGSLSVSASSFTGTTTRGVLVDATDTAVATANIATSTFDVGAGTGRGIELNAASNSRLNFDISTNPTISVRNGDAISLNSSGLAILRGTINNNANIDLNDGFGSGVDLFSKDDSTIIVRIKQNIITMGAELFGAVYINSPNITGNTSRIDATIDNNTIILGTSSNSTGIELANAASNVICANITNNQVSDGTGINQVGLLVDNRSVWPIQLQGFTGNLATTWQNNGNISNADFAQTFLSSGSVTSGTCNIP